LKQVALVDFCTRAPNAGDAGYLQRQSAVISVCEERKQHGGSYSRFDPEHSKQLPCRDLQPPMRSSIGVKGYHETASSVRPPFIETLIRQCREGAVSRLPSSWALVLFIFPHCNARCNVRFADRHFRYIFLITVPWSFAIYGLTINTLTLGGPAGFAIGRVDDEVEMPWWT
jgi:hypothetical protein